MFLTMTAIVEIFFTKESLLPTQGLSNGAPTTKVLNKNNKQYKNSETMNEANYENTKPPVIKKTMVQ